MPDWAWTLVRVASVLAGAVLLVAAGRLAIRRFERKLLAGGLDLAPHVARRTRTLTSVLSGGLTLLVALVAFVVSLSELGIAIGPLIAAAGVVGVALGFGAQTLVRDLIAGFFIILESQYDVGDVIRVAGVAGTVEDVNLRSTVLREIDGTRHVVSNGEIQVSSNETKVFSRYLLILPIPYDEDPDRAIAVMRRAFAGVRADPEFGPAVTQDIEILGVDEYGASSVDVKAYVQTIPGEQWRVGREFRRRLKHALDVEGISIPFPHREVIMRTAPSGPAPGAAVPEPEGDAADDG